MINTTVGGPAWTTTQSSGPTTTPSDPHEIRSHRAPRQPAPIRRWRIGAHLTGAASTATCLTGLVMAAVSAAGALAVLLAGALGMLATAGASVVARRRAHSTR